MVGMSHVLSIEEKGHAIHFGLRQNKLVIRAVSDGRILEFVESELFGKDDLPLPCVQNCYHWLVVHDGSRNGQRNGHLLIRKHPEPFKEVDSNWMVDVYSRQAMRRKSIMLDPRCELCASVGKIFAGFEDPSQITVFQAPRRLRVELKRFQLDFYVKENGLLTSYELGAEIDPNQNPGTFYGLRSMIVLRKAQNRSRRSIIVPRGKLQISRNLFHVNVRVESDSFVYMHYAIDQYLGRLTCHAESVPLYLKAQLHAYTSFILPDPLTKRTGTEEALSCLRSGLYQPYAPLNEFAYDALQTIRSLSPRREYYPKNLKQQQQVSWENNLQFTMQHDGFEEAVDNILEESQRLSIFAPSTFTFELPVASNAHLRRRGLCRQTLNERSYCQAETPAFCDLKYKSRDDFVPNTETKNVKSIVNLIRSWPSRVRATRHFAGFFEAARTIGGIDPDVDREVKSLSISERISIDLAKEWANLTSMCQECGSGDASFLMFHFGLMAFNEKVDMTILQTFLAFSFLNDLKEIQCPPFAEYTHFKYKEPMTAEILHPVASNYHLPFEPHAVYQNDEERRRHPLQYLERCNSDAKDFARYLSAQWPNENPTTEGFETTVLDVSKAIEFILPMWNRLYANLQLSQYIDEVQQVLDAYSTTNETTVSIQELTSPLPTVVYQRSKERWSIPSLSDCLSNPFRASLLSDPSSRLPSLKPSVQHNPYAQHCQSTLPEVLALESIVERVSSAGDYVRQKYADDLRMSLAAFKTHASPLAKVYQLGFQRPVLVHAIGQYVQFLEDRLNIFKQDLGMSNDGPFYWLALANLSPAVTTVTLLEQLRSNVAIPLDSSMKSQLLAFGLQIVELQRYNRVLGLFNNEQETALSAELENEGHVNWDPADHPDWLLFEIDANILIRGEQVDVARATISPESGSNSVLQLNMGKGMFIYPFLSSCCRV